jgi:hypothetical protein
MSEIQGTVYVDCPCCGARLVARREDGKVVAHWAKPRPAAKGGEDPLKAATDRLKAEKAKRANFLDDAKARLENEKRELEERFRKERERVHREGDTSRPPSPFDLD